MLTVGLTGQSGAGKGVFGSVISKYDNVRVLDTDITARLVVEKGQPCLEELCECFGKEILKEDGSLDRKKLACVAFSDEQRHECLNRITHRHIMKKITEWKDNCEKDGVNVAVIDAPLLFESGADKLCDVTIGVISPYEIRLERVMKRDGIQEKDARLRLDSQPNDEFFISKCTYIISNSTDEKDFEENANKLIDKLLNEQNKQKGCLQI